MSPPEIRCAHSELVAIEKLTPHPRNPNEHPSEQIELLAKLIQNHGWRLPIVVSKRSGFVVNGHGRLAAAKKLGLKEVPVDRQDFDSDEAELAHLIADNRIAELAEPNIPKLKDLLQELDTGAFDMDLTGYTEDILEMMMTAAPPPATAELEIETSKTFTCPNCGFETEVA